MIVKKNNKGPKLQNNKNKKNENKKQLLDLSLILKFNDDLVDISSIKALEYLQSAKKIKKVSSNTFKVIFNNIESFSSCKDYIEGMSNGPSIVPKYKIDTNKEETVTIPITVHDNVKENEKSVEKMYKEITKFIRKSIVFPEAIFSNTIIVKNIPNAATKGQVQELFPDALDISVKYPTETRNNCIAIIVMPNIESAKRLSKTKITMDNRRLYINTFKPNKYALNK